MSLKKYCSVIKILPLIHTVLTFLRHCIHSISYNLKFECSFKIDIDIEYGPKFLYHDVLYILGHNKRIEELHNPYETILQRQFINNLIVLAYHLYKKDHP